MRGRDCLYLAREVHATAMLDQEQWPDAHPVRSLHQRLRHRSVRVRLRREPLMRSKARWTHGL